MPVDDSADSGGDLNFRKKEIVFNNELKTLRLPEMVSRWIVLEKDEEQ